MTVQPHLHRALIYAFVQGDVESEGDLQAIAEHLAHCRTCELEYDTLAASSVQPSESGTSSHASTVRAADVETLDVSPRSPTIELPAELKDHPRWKWLGRLGRGGHGAVYLARHKVLRDQLRAIKIIAAPLDIEADATKRILREVNTIRRVPPHENLLQIYDVERIGMFHLIVMEHVLGQDLESLANKQPLGRFDPSTAVGFVLQTLAALDHASSTGLVHRDLKPANLMVTPDGLIKVLDFGLAKIRSEAQTSITVAGIQGCGSAEYLAPEQARDLAAADVRSDLYSLGCTLYRLIAGHPPFGVHTGHAQVWQVHAAHAQQMVPPLVDVCPGVPQGLSNVVSRLLAKHPGERFSSAKEAALALYPFADSEGQRQATWLSADRPDISLTTSAARGRRNWTPYLVAGLLSLLVLSLGIVMQFRTKSGIIELEVEDPSVDVKIDDKAVERTRIKLRQKDSKHWLLIEAEPGSRELKISRPGFQVASANVEVLMGKSSPVRIRLTPNDDSSQAAEGKSVPAEKPHDRRATLVQTSGGRWAIEEDELRHHDGNGDEWLLFGDPSWVDYDFTFEVRQEGFPTGVTAVYRSLDDEHFQHFGYAWLNLRTSLAEYRDPTSFYHQVQKEGKPLRVELNDPIVSGRWYRLKVEVRGETSKFFVDDQHLLTVDDNLYDRGRVGVRIWRKWQGITRFRSFRVLAPDGSMLWKGLPKLPAEQTGKLMTPDEIGSGSTATTQNPDSDLLQPGSVWSGSRSYRKGAWAGSTVSYDLHIDSRDGASFSGHKFDNGPGRNRCQVNGRIEGGSITWRESSKGTSNLIEVEGTIQHNLVQLRMTGKHANGVVYTEGDGVLRLKGNHP